MKLLSNISGKVLVIALVVIVVLLVVIVTFFAPPPTPIVNPPPVNPPDLVSIDNPITSESYPYVGVNANDTLVADNAKDKPLVINLDHRHWQHVTWSPDGKQIAVLGQAKPASQTAVYDLYLYTLATNNWKRLTLFGDGADGITGYSWKPDGNLVFTQGQGNENWMHLHTLQSNETRKLFRVSAALKSYLGVSGFYVLTRQTEANSQLNNITAQVLKPDGTVVRAFEGADLSADSKLINVHIGRSEQELVLEGLVGEVRGFYTWDLNELALVKQLIPQTVAPVSFPVTSQPAMLNYNLICARDAELFWGYVYAVPADGFDVVNIHFSTRDTASAYSELSSVDKQSAVAVDSRVIYCGVAKALLPIQYTTINGLQTAWYLLQSDKLTELTTLQNFKEVVVK